MWVSELRGKNHKVAMVGDGINDAPAPGEADVKCHGVGNRCGQRERRCHPDWKRPVQTCRNLAGARRCRGIVMQNFAGTLIVDTVGVGMAAFGFLNPLLAAFIHVASELTFILNSTGCCPEF